MLLENAYFSTNPLSFNPHPTRRLDATCHPPSHCYHTSGFNPHPTRRLDATTATCPECGAPEGVSILIRPEGRMLQNQGVLKIDRRVNSEMTAVLFLRLSQAIDAQVVFFVINAFDEVSDELLVLRLIDQALEYRFLYPLAKVFTNLGDFAQPSFPALFLGRHIIRDQDLHSGPSS